MRSLIKEGNLSALKLLRFEKVKISVSRFDLLQPQVQMGDNLGMEIQANGEIVTSKTFNLDLN